MNLNKKYLPLVIGAVIIVIAIVAFLVLSNKKNQSQTQTSNQIPTSEIIPTVDSSVKVNLKAGPSGKGYIQLAVNGIPSGTDTIEYEMSYNTAQQGMQGIANEPVPVKGKTSFSKELFLGTQSSGAKTYHTVVGPIHVDIKFNGSYGAKSFSKDFEL